MSTNVTLRLAQRADIPEVTRITNAANAKSEIHRRLAPNQHRYALDYYYWRLNFTRQRFVTKNTRTIVAEDSSSSEILGLASWAVEGADTALYKEWTSESTWADWLEQKLIWVERTWSRWLTDRSIDYKFLNSFFAAYQAADYAARPACLHLHLIVVDPSTQSRGVGRVLADWGKELAAKEGLPLFLEANLEATGFYDKGGFSRLSKDFVVTPKGEEPLRIPVYVWEGRQREGRWLERDTDFAGAGERWRWKDDVLSK